MRTNRNCQLGNVPIAGMMKAGLIGAYITGEINTDNTTKRVRTHVAARAEKQMNLQHSDNKLWAVIYIYI